VLKSTDGGMTWTQTGAAQFAPAGAAGARIAKLAIHPTTTSTLLVASDFGLYRSIDGGGTYNQVLTGTATDVVIDPTTPSTMYAAIGNAFGSVSNGVYKSTDTGATWNPLAGGLPAANVGRINLAIAASASATVYASVQDSLSDPTPANRGTLLGIFKTVTHSRSCPGRRPPSSPATTAACGSPSTAARAGPRSTTS
jgi:hypothetical protein